MKKNKKKSSADILYVGLLTMAACVLVAGIIGSLIVGLAG